MNIEQGVIVGGILSTIIPVGSVFLRGKSRYMMFSTLAVAAAGASYLGILYRLVAFGDEPVPVVWVQALVASGVPALLAGCLFTAGFGRENPVQSFRDSRKTLALLGFFGVVALLLVRQPGFITGYEWGASRGTIFLGALGKAYISYLLIGVVSIGYSLEKTYRVADSGVSHRLRLPFLGVFALLGFFTFVLATGALYSAIGIGKLAASSLPIALASVVMAYGYIRGEVQDVTAPVSRGVVYSSFTAFAAGLFVFAIGVTAQIASVTSWTPGEVLIVSVGFLSIMASALFLFSNRFKRRVRRFIDRNFYVNRYDYRTQWSKISESIKDATDREGVLDGAAQALEEVFLADKVTIALEEDATHDLRPMIGKGEEEPTAVLRNDSPLVQGLILEGRSLLLDRKSDDFSYIPIYAENGAWLDATASQIVAPLLDGAHLLGTLGLERTAHDDPFTFEDATLLDSIAGHVAASLRSVQLAQEVVESREIELMSQWSSMLLHDLKNHLGPLRMVATNLVENSDNPEAALICAEDIKRVADRMEALTRTLSELREHYELGMHPISPNQIVEETLSELQLSRRASVQVDLRLEAQQKIRGDEKMLRRVMGNLVTNAVEAMNGDGKLSIWTRDRDDSKQALVQTGVVDTGCGMSDEFVREKLFRPFQTTKRKGLGLGLYQCRLIIRAHGGNLTVKSRVGKGSEFQTSLGAAS